MKTRQGILVTDLTLIDERKIKLNHNSIVVITGPNNVGKTTLLLDIERFFRRHGGTNYKGRVLKEASYRSNGNADPFIDLMKEEAKYDEDDDVIQVPGGRYKVDTLRKSFTEDDLPKAVQEYFVEALDPRERLGGYYNRVDPVEKAADLLFFDEATEARISAAFHKAFGADMILHRERRGGVFMLGQRKNIPSHKKRLTPAYRKQASKLPQIMEQGAGMRSFARIALQLMT